MRHHRDAAAPGDHRGAPKVEPDRLHLRRVAPDHARRQRLLDAGADGAQHRHLHRVQVAHAGDAGLRHDLHHHQVARRAERVVRRARGRPARASAAAWCGPRGWSCRCWRPCGSPPLACSQPAPPAARQGQRQQTLRRGDDASAPARRSPRRAGRYARSRSARGRCRPTGCRARGSAAPAARRDRPGRLHDGEARAAEAVQHQRRAGRQRMRRQGEQRHRHEIQRDAAEVAPPVGRGRHQPARSAARRRRRRRRPCRRAARPPPARAAGAPARPPAPGCCRASRRC